VGTRERRETKVETELQKTRMNSMIESVNRKMRNTLNGTFGYRTSSTPRGECNTEDGFHLQAAPLDMLMSVVNYEVDHALANWY
jgi:hypothetical protein